jgi:chemotaxis protein methyltransferase CheR
MTDADCITFLQWALPRLEMRWAGFRKVRHQVCKRLKRRIATLGLEGFAGYRERLEADPREWQAVDACCRITISRFFRDRHVFEALARHVLPEIGARAQREGREARCWCVGCAAGEEPYTLKILWNVETRSASAAAGLSVIATDTSETLLERARKARYGATSLRELPPDLIAQAFDRVGSLFCVREQHRNGIIFVRQDVRGAAPTGPFDLVLCRNLAFTYFAPALQQRLLARMAERLPPGGCLVIGAKEELPEPTARFAPLACVPHAFEKRC